MCIYIYIYTTNAILYSVRAQAAGRSRARTGVLLFRVLLTISRYHTICRVRPTLPNTIIVYLLILYYIM